VPAALALCATLLAAGCSRPAPDMRPHIVLVVCDALRADHLDLHGYERATAPALAAWAEGGLVFQQATAPSNWTRPSVLSLFTGRDPMPDRILRPSEPLPDDEPVLAEVLSEAGYRTAAVSANPFVSRALGADRGFDEFVDLGWRGNERRGHWKEEIAAPFVLQRVEYLLATRETDERPLFLYVHLMDPHLPYDPPERFRSWCQPDYAGPIDGATEPFRVLGGEHVDERLSPGDREQVVALYDGEIARLDEGLVSLRALIDEHLGDRPVVTVVTADHGEVFGEGRRGAYMHGVGLDPGLLRVPLVLHGAGDRGVVGERVGLIDLAPTLAALAGASWPEAIDGRDLLAGTAPAGRDLIAYRALPDGEAPGHGELAVLRDGWRAERIDGGWRLFDVQTGVDHTEQRPDLLRDLSRAANRWLERWEQRGATAAADREVEMPEDVEERLRTLGYLGR
jgi:arylsulfatase